MTPTPKRANSKKKIRESLSLVVNAIQLEARSEFVWRLPHSDLEGKPRVFVSLFSRVSPPRSRCPQTTARRRANARDSSQAFLRYKSVQSRYKPISAKPTTTTTTLWAEGKKGYKVCGAQSSTIRRLLCATKAYYRVCCARAFF